MLCLLNFEIFFFKSVYQLCDGFSDTNAWLSVNPVSCSVVRCSRAYLWCCRGLSVLNCKNKHVWADDVLSQMLVQWNRPSAMIKKATSQLFSRHLLLRNIYIYIETDRLYKNQFSGWWDYWQLNETRKQPELQHNPDKTASLQS